MSFSAPEGKKSSDFVLRNQLNFVRWKHVSLCSDYLNEKQQFKEAVDCSSEVFNGKEMSEFQEIELPACYVIREDAPMIFKDLESNYIPLLHPAGYIMPVLGLYSSENKTIILVEHVDIEQVYRHEVQHFLLHILEEKGTNYNAEGMHSYKIWKECEAPTHRASKKAIRVYNKRELSQRNILMNLMVRFSMLRNNGFIFTFDVQ